MIFRKLNQVRCKIAISVFVSFFAACPFLQSNSYAQLFTVTNASDSGPGSLRQAIIDMNDDGISPSAIRFQMSGSTVINLTSALPSIHVSVNLNSTGVSGIVLDGTNAGSADGLVFAESEVDPKNWAL
jgi:hypothetical protein